MIKRACDVQKTPTTYYNYYLVCSWEAYDALMQRLEELDYRWMEGQHPTGYKVHRDPPHIIEVRSARIRSVRMNSKVDYSTENTYADCPLYRIVL